MKINYERFPALYKDIKMVDWGNYDEDGIRELQPIIKTVMDNKNAHVLYFSENFRNKLHKIYPKLISLIPMVPRGEYMILIDRKGYLSETVFITAYDNGFKSVVTERGFFPDDPIEHKYSNEIRVEADEDVGDVLVFSKGEIWLDAEKGGYNANAIAFAGLLMYHYGDVETLVLNKNNKRGKINGVKHLSETDQQVKVIDSTWITTLINNASFKVGGHFRLQPFGEGKKDRKLIWISEYEKHGYTREAGILKNKD